MTGLRTLSFVTVVLMATLQVSRAAATWTTIDVPGVAVKDTNAVGVNSAGDVVGTYTDTAIHGFLLRGGVFTNIEPPNSIGSLATGINDAGEIVGYFTPQGDVHEHGFLFDGQNYATLDFPGALNTFAWGINNTGDVVGFYADSNSKFHGFKWNNGGFATIDVPDSQYTVLQGLDDFGHIVGYYLDMKGNQRGFATSSRGEFRYFRNSEAAAGVNNHKIVVGYNLGFRFNLATGSFLMVKFPNAVETACFGINDLGQIVGNYRDAAGKTHGFLRTS